MLRWRLLSAILGIPLLLGVTYLGGWPLAGFMALLGALAAAELGRLLPHGVPLLARAGAVLYPLAARGGPAALVPAGALVLIGVLAGETVRARRSGAGGAGFDAGVAASRAAWGALAAFYPGFLLASMVLVEEAHGWRGAWYVLFVVWAADTASYFAGHLAARGGAGAKRPFPELSPGKTVAGTWAGLLAGAAAGAVLAYPLRPFCLSCGSGLFLAAGGLLLGLTGSAAALAGDLFESLLKRAAGRKDAGALIPGHGGVLDRFDSLAFAAPAMLWLMRLLELRALTGESFLPIIT